MTSITDVPQSSAADFLDPTIAPPPPLVDVSETSFEGRFEDWADDARYFEYSKAANPLAGGTITAIPARQFGPELHTEGATGIVPLDLSDALGIHDGPATSPGLVANFLRIRAGDRLHTAPNATSEFYYVMYGPPRGGGAASCLGSVKRFVRPVNPAIGRVYASGVQHFGASVRVPGRRRCAARVHATPARAARRVPAKTKARAIRQLEGLG